MKKVKCILLIILLAVSVGCVLYASIMQRILCYQMYGVIFTSETVFIPHESAWFFLGILGYYPVMKLWEGN
jgi:hypothetical protein